MIRVNIFISVFRLFFLEKISHIPINPNIRNTDNKENEIIWVVVICSATESVSESVDVKNGFTAFRYLKLGWGINPEKDVPTPVTSIDTRKMKQLRILVFSELNFLMISEITTNIVENARIIPAYPMINAEERSNINENKIKLIENTGAAHIEKFFSLLKKGKKI